MVDRTLSGVYPVLYMPFDDRSRIDVEDLRKEVEFVVAAGLAGVGIAMGSEIFKLSEAELTGEVLNLPDISDVETSVDVRLIVEFYSR